jgi:hypothetical protein
MSQSRFVSYAALTVAVLALVVSSLGVAGGLAEAAGHKIGKNLVVTKSIKKGAVTGKKVKDGSLTVADLAPGTIPAPGNGKSVELAACNCLFSGANQTSPMQPVGVASGGGLPLTVPVSVQIADVHVGLATQGPGQSVTFSIQYFPPGAGAFLALPLCTVASGQNSCVATGPLAIPAGSNFYIQMSNGPGGAFGGSVQLGYTMHAV